MQTGRCLYVLPIKLYFECWVLQWNLVNRVFVHRTFETLHEADLVWNSNLTLDSIKHLKCKDFLSFWSKENELLCDVADEEHLSECRVFELFFCFICFWVKFGFPALICVQCFVALWFLWCRVSYDEVSFVISCVLVHIMLICSSLTRVAVLDFLWLILFHKMRILNQTRGVIIAAVSLSGHTRQCDSHLKKQNLSLQESKGSSSF